MNTGGDLELEMRLMDSKLRKINKECTKKKKKLVLKSCIRTNDISKRSKPKGKVVFDLKNIEYI